MTTTRPRKVASAKIDTDKLGKLIRLLGSDKDGEVLAAVGALRRALRADGRDLHDLADAVALGLKPSTIPALSPTPARRPQSRPAWAPPDPDLDNWESMAWYAHFHRWRLRTEQRERVADYLLGVAFGDNDGRCAEWHMRELRSIVAAVRSAR
jgi:hypothetical protein